MRIWTFQSPKVYEALQKGCTYQCDITKSALCNEFKSFKRAYEWMDLQMKDHISGIDANTYPVWCWYKWNNENKRPDLRYAEFKYRDDMEYLLELEVPDNQILLSDFDDWHMVLNNIEEENWQDIFNIAKSSYVQACIPRIEPNWVISAKLCPAHPMD